MELDPLNISPMEAMSMLFLFMDNKKEYYNITKQNQPNQWVRPEKIMEIKGQDILKSVSYTACYAYMNDKKYDTSI